MDNSQSAKTLWTSVISSSKPDFLAGLALLTPEQIKEIVNQSFKEAEKILPDLLKPYETKLSQETLFRVLGCL